MARRHEQQEDPWAGFVDVLSNIVMVVTFLVIILGIAIFALSQQITKNAVEQAIAQVREEQKNADPPPADPAAQEALDEAKAEIEALRKELESRPDVPAPPPPSSQVPVAALEAAQAEIAALKEALAKPPPAVPPPPVDSVPVTELQSAKAEIESLKEALANAPTAPPPPPVDSVPASELESAKAEIEALKQQIAATPAEPIPGARPELVSPDGETTDGAYRPAIAERIAQPDEIEGNTNLTVRSRDDMEATEITVAAEDSKVDQEPVTVERAEAFVTLRFTKASFKLDEAATGALRDYLQANSETLKGNGIEVRAFASSTTGSITEARRIAYYRAMQIRNELVRNGVAAADLKVFVRESGSATEADVVRIFAAP